MVSCEEVVVCSRTIFVLFKLEINAGALEERDSVYENKEKKGKTAGTLAQGRKKY